jgi:hypothetical protein
MPFALDSNPQISELSEAINYLLGNFGANLSADPNTGQIKGPTGNVIAYLYKYLAVKYADSADGATNFSDSPINRQYYGLRNSDQSVESTNPADYIWSRVDGGFGTTKLLWYQTSGGRQIQFVVTNTSPALGFAPAPTTAIDLDIITSTLATPAFLAYFQPAALQVIRSGSPLTPSFTGVIPRLYATAGGVLSTFVTAQTDSDPAFGINTWRIGGSATTGYGSIAYNQITIETPTNGGGYALWPTPTAMSGTPATLTVPVRFKNSLGIVEQSTPAILQFVFSDQGSNGSQIAYPSVYQWNTSIPTVTGTSTYTWSSSTFTPTPSGWSQSPGVGSPGFTLYRAEVTLTAVAGTTTSTINWTTASVLAIGSAGTNGTNGNNGTNGTSSRICFSRIAGNPAPVSGIITTTGNSSFPSNTQSLATWGIDTTWGATDPSPTSTNSLYQADGIYNPATNLTSWTTPYISSLKVGQLSAVSTNTGSLTINGTVQAGTAAISGTTMTGAGGVLYNGGNFAFGNATTNISFNGTQMTLNGNVVNTANLASNSVTLADSAFTAASFLNTDAATWQDAQTISIITTGSRVYVAAAGLPLSGSALDVTDTIDIIPKFRIVRGTTELMQGGTLAAMSYSDTPTAGTYTYRLQVRSDFPGSPIAYAGVSNRSLFVMELKR